jgi:cell division protein ZapA (FtsZ GTPase activity inhibitor)
MTEHITVTVTIQGVEFSFKTDDPEYIKGLAEFVDGHIDRITSSDNAIAPTKAVTLAAFNIADELFRLQSEKSELSQEVSSRIDAMLHMAEETYRSTGKAGETG